MPKGGVGALKSAKWRLLESRALDKRLFDVAVNAPLELDRCRTALYTQEKYKLKIVINYTSSI